MVSIVAGSLNLKVAEWWMNDTPRLAQCCVSVSPANTRHCPDAGLMLGQRLVIEGSLIVCVVAASPSQLVS